MTQRLISLGWMTALWVAFWGDLSVANVVGGIAVGSVILVLVPLRGLSAGLRVHPIWLMRLGAYFLWKLIEASVIVAWGVVAPVNRLNQAVVAVPLHTTSSVLAAIVGNMVSLTPGTLTLDVIGDPPVLYVHVMQLHSDEQEVESIHTLEALVLLAFTDKDHLPIPRTE